MKTKLGDLLQRVDQLDDELDIYAAKPWSVESEARAVRGPEDGSMAPLDGMDYLLDVDNAREVIKVWSDWRGGAEPTPEDRCEAVAFYAEWDAFLPSDTMG